jgi:trans-aconitate 3-methyltransferase
MEVLLRLERETLAPYALPGNIISMNMYDDLPLPWNITPPVSDFPQSKFVKLEYDREGVLSNGVSFFNNDEREYLDDIENGLSTASMVTRWRAAKPELVGTDKDVVKVFARELREALEGKQDWVVRGSGTAILLFKKSV